MSNQFIVELFVNVTLLMAIAQSSAAFVAIVAGLFTQKLFAIAGERKKLNDKIKELNGQITAKHEVIKVHQDTISRIMYNRGWQGLNRTIFYFGFKQKEIVTPEDFTKQFMKLNDDKQPNDIQKQIIETEFQEILSEIGEQVRERAKKEQEGSQGVQYAIRPSDFETREDIQNKESIRQEARTIADSTKDIATGGVDIRNLNNVKKDLEIELSSIYSPKHVGIGFATLVYFAIAGVILPITYEYWWTIALKNTNTIIVIAFITGLGAVLAYIYTELRSALSK